MHLSWIVITFSLFLAGPTNSKKKDLLKSSTDLLEKESKRLKSSKSGCSLKAINARAIDYLRINNEYEKAIPCLIQVLQESGSQTDSWLWASLGHVYQNLQKTALATSSFKQASKLLGKVSSFIKEWHFLGPFVIGKMEVDGDPVAAMGGIANVSANRYKKGWKMFSELISEGEVKWQTHIQKAPGQILQISPDVKWGELVNSLGSVGITEWQGWLVGEFAVTENGQNILLQCEGVNTVLVDGLPIVGDVYHRENFWFSVQLERGIHSIYIRLRTKAVQNVKCEIKITTSSFDILKPHFLPDLIDGYLFTGYIPLPIVNTHSTKWLKNIKITVQEQSDGSDLSVASPHIPYDIAPGQAMPIVIKLISNEAEIVEECIDVMLKLKVSTSEGQLLYPITLRCRRQRESFLFTFVDHDGSVQHAAAIQPLRDCEGGVCPVLLTLHGTTVPPQNQADSYKRMSNGKFIFGLEKAWVLAPTRHGAHNWEGPGALTAMTALNQLEELLKGSKIFRNLASKNHVIFAGHSMGGHGAWHLSTHFPDHALAVISLAGWIKKEEYGDSNLFFRHDIATSHVDPAVKSVMEACISENDADRHASNLKGVPVLLRIGAMDKTVHPYFVRRMYRILQESGVAVEYKEIPGKEHWWWDTRETNDGGAVNDKQLRDFTSKYASIPIPEEGSTCTADSCSTVGSGNKYTATASGPDSFTYTVLNPAFGGSMRGIQILLQVTPFRTSKIQVDIIKDSSIMMKTSNVKAFSIRRSENRPIQWHIYQEILIDNTAVNLAGQECLEQIFVLEEEQAVWGQPSCSTDILGSKVRLPDTQGPARRVAEKPFLIVTGSQAGNEVTQQLRQLSVYLANLFFLTSDTMAPVIKDEDLKEEQAEKHNLIIIGNPDENKFTKEAISHVPIRLIEDGLKLGRCSFPVNQTGAVFLSPHAGNHLALVIMGTSSQGLLDAISLATPTIPPMARSPFSNLVPDFVLTGKDYQAKGPGGYLCTGFWGNQWEFRPELVSCTC